MVYNQNNRGYSIGPTLDSRRPKRSVFHANYRLARSHSPCADRSPRVQRKLHSKSGNNSRQQYRTVSENKTNPINLLPTCTCALHFSLIPNTANIAKVQCHVCKNFGHYARCCHTFHQLALAQKQSESSQQIIRAAITHSYQQVFISPWQGRLLLFYRS